MNRFWIGLGLVGLLALPPVRQLLEYYMITHMLVQMPLLIIAGVLMGDFLVKRFPNIFEKWDHTGISGILLVYFITMYWMIPRAMDEALTLSTIETFKYISLPFLVGIPLRHSWGKLSGVVKGFIVFNYIPMFALMAWLYIDSPIQICNNYLETEQKFLGWGFMFITLLMLIYIIQLAFIDHSSEEGQSV